MQGPNHGVTREEGAMVGYAYGAGIDKKEGRNSNTGGRQNNIDPGKAWDTTFGNNGLWRDIRGGSLGTFWDTTFGNRGMLGNIRGRFTRWWRYQTHNYTGDWLRSAIKDLIIIDVCNKYGDSSQECENAKIMDYIDTNLQRRKYDKNRDIDLTGGKEVQVECGASQDIEYFGGYSSGFSCKPGSPISDYTNKDQSDPANHPDDPNNQPAGNQVYMRGEL